MKQIYSIAVIFLIILLFVGCFNQEQPTDYSCLYYYTVCNLELAQEVSVIKSETRQRDPTDDTFTLLKQYLCGPTSEELLSPFPPNTLVDHIAIDGSTATVYLTPALATLSGHNRTIACACLAKTVIGITRCESVTIDAGAENNPSRIHVTMTQEDILLIDNAQTTREVSE